ncbi:MAG TPA: amidase [Ramlibacter sp.]|uniref:amidase n=1 Tax=Ramlibacter sp. TaxID=1917967 RepID=UPI002C84D169|nr:amidase [Ramlibacter sp.]HVZ43295.1 amidase [Ramlibacter sp.]
MSRSSSGAAAAARSIASGETSAEQVVRDCLDRIREREPAVGAWQWLDEQHAIEQARACDRLRDAGGPCGPLHGVPVGIKDIVDTADMPTELGTVVHAGRRPASDAAVVWALRAAGAVILGKTVTTELATYSPGKTRNPLDATRTPGGSSSGSAAAVAAGMVPLALGTQTNGSVIRPAGFCGVHALKPTHGALTLEGVLRVSPSLDTVGFFGTSLEDLELVCGALGAFAPAQPLAAPPRLAFVRTPLWPRTEPALRAAFDEMLERLGGDCEEWELPAALEPAWDWHTTIMEAEMAFHLRAEWDRRHELSPSLQGQLARGRETSAFGYQRAQSGAQALRSALGEVFSVYDAIVTPGTFGVAPLGLESTGDPAFCTPWSLAGVPACNVPLLKSPEGLPIGLQLVGARGADMRLLRIASWLEGRVGP